MEDDDEAAVELLESLERQIGRRAAPLADIEELGKRRRDHPARRFVEDETARQDREVVPTVLVYAAWRVDVDL